MRQVHRANYAILDRAGRARATTIVTLRQTLDLAARIRAEALARGDDDLAAREEAHIAELERQIAALEWRLTDVESPRVEGASA